jgi:DNA processing protein
MAALTDKERLSRLRLSRSENIGPVTFRRLLDLFGSAEKALERAPDMAKRGGKKEFVLCTTEQAEAEIAALDKIKARMVVWGDAEYPALLAEIPDPPPVIAVLGNVGLLNKSALGVVGARNASLNGRRLAESFSAQIGRTGYVIVSGLARGIDSAAHGATLDTGTVAVVAGGIDVVYPPENQKLYDQIAQHGAIVAESPFGTEPLARHFPRRNRIISGLSLGVLVVEAAEKSGSLITARMALEQNRDVFAVPGSPLDPRAGGTNQLIKDGAIMTLGAEDVIQGLHASRLKPLREGNTPFEGPPLDLSPSEDLETLRENVLSQLNHTPVDINMLTRALNCRIEQLIPVLLELELAGRIERSPGNKVNLI